MNKQQQAILVAAIIGAIATFLPWSIYSAGAFGYSVSRSTDGFHGSGVMYLVVMLAVGAYIVLSKHYEVLQKFTRLLMLGCGALCLLLILLFYSNSNDQASAPYGIVSTSIGFGMILGFLCSLSLIAIPLLLKLPNTPSIQADIAEFTNILQGVKTSINAKKITTRPSHPNTMEEMERLITWRAEGKITQQEFDALKTKIM